MYVLVLERINGKVAIGPFDTQEEAYSFSLEHPYWQDAEVVLLSPPGLKQV